MSAQSTWPNTRVQRLPVRQVATPVVQHAASRPRIAVAGTYTGRANPQVAPTGSFSPGPRSPGYGQKPQVASSGYGQRQQVRTGSFVAPAPGPPVVRQVVRRGGGYVTQPAAARGGPSTRGYITQPAAARGGPRTVAAKGYTTTATRVPTVVQRTVRVGGSYAAPPPATGVAPIASHPRRLLKQEPAPDSVIPAGGEKVLSQPQNRWLCQWQREREQHREQQKQKRLERLQRQQQGIPAQPFRPQAGPAGGAHPVSSRSSSKESQQKVLAGSPPVARPTSTTAQQKQPTQPDVGAVQRFRGANEAYDEQPEQGEVEAEVPANEQPPLNNEVVEFIKQCGLPQYASALLAGGFDSMEMLQEMDDADFRDLNMPRGHMLKIRRHLRDRNAGWDQGAASDALGINGLPGSKIKGLPRSSSIGNMQLPGDHPIFFENEDIKSDVQKSWDRIREIGVLRAGEVLYKTLFKLNPIAKGHLEPAVLAKYHQCSFDFREVDPDVLENATLSKMFGRIFNAVGAGICGLHDLNTLVPMLYNLGMRHINYNSPEPFWAVVGTAFNMTIHELLGDELTPDVEHLWMVGYNFISAVMIQGMRDAFAAAALVKEVQVAAEEEEVEDYQAEVGFLNRAALVAAAGG